MYKCPAQFKPVLFKGHLYLGGQPCAEPETGELRAPEAL